ncbi:hypothetical protein GJ496_000583 [Pomphorhynchus laevis]|nr:hypothetical protein GJ496_000583 [Pomphorhynchus laevis]
MFESRYSEILNDLVYELSALVTKDINDSGEIKFKDVNAEIRYFSNMYVDYILMTKKFDYLYNDIATNKGQANIVYDIIQFCMGRIYELRLHMIQLDFCEFQYLDDILLSRGILPSDYVSQAQISKIFVKYELARQARCKIHAMKLKALSDVKTLMIDTADKQMFTDIVKRSFFRKNTFPHLKDEDSFSESDYESEASEQSESSESTDELQLLDDVITDIHCQKVYQSLIDQWMLETRSLTGSMPPFVTNEYNGFLHIFQNKTKEDLKSIVSEVVNKSKSAKTKIRNPQNQKKKDETKKNTKTDPIKMKISKFTKCLNQSIQAYADDFLIGSNNNLPDNLTSLKFDFSNPKNIQELHAMLDKDVTTIQKAFDKKVKMAVNPINLTVNEKTRRKYKKRNTKTTLSRKTFSSIIGELVLHNIISVPEETLEQFVGESQLIGSYLRENGFEPMPNLIDVRTLATIMLAFPLVSQKIWEAIEHPIKTVLLAGPKGCGKGLLTRSLCGSTGALLVDLSPSNLHKKYKGKVGQKMLRLLISQVVQNTKPIVIYMRDCDVLFTRKLSKAEKKMQPKKMMKFVRDIKKLLKPDKRVIIIGTSSNPQRMMRKRAENFFNFNILIPRPNYGSRYEIWATLLKQISGTDTCSEDFIRTLANVSDGFCGGQFKHALSQVYSKERMTRLDYDPVEVDEIYSKLSCLDMVFKDDEDLLKKWYLKTSLASKRDVDTFEEEIEY